MKSYLGTDDELPYFWGPQWNKILAELTLQGRWEKVVEIYREFPEAHTATIKESMGTALHVAIEFNKEKFVDQLVEAIIIEKHRKEEQPRMIPEGLEKAINGRGDTPLHVAASRGFPRLCKLIVGPEKQERTLLAIVKNNVGETPLFQAALAGSRAAFAYLSEISRDSVVVARDLVRDNGDSILHCAIKREFVDLAVVIVDRYPSLIGHASTDGFTPLKVLAKRPYTCMKKFLEEIDQQQPRSFPMNYETICEFWKRYISFSPLGKLYGKFPKKDPQRDPEDPRTRLEGGFLPPNYAAFEQIFRSAYAYALVLSGVGLDDIRETKAKHIWSRQLLDVLMKDGYNAYFGAGLAWTMFPSDQMSQDSIEQPAQKETSSQKALEGTEPDQATDTDSKETPLLLAAKKGISEMVIEILDKLPSTLHGTNTKKENVLLVAVLNRQPLVVETLRKKVEQGIWNNLILAEDEKENTMLHLAAQAQGKEKHKQIAGSALQMMWDIKWYEV